MHQHRFFIYEFESEFEEEPELLLPFSLLLAFVEEEVDSVLPNNED
jgi:hypothetical protein